MPKPGLRIAIWAGAAVLATTAATVAIGFSQGARPDVLNANDIANHLANQAPVAGPVRGSASPGPDDGAGHGQGTPSGAAGPSQVLTSTGGSVVVQCSGDTAMLVSWAPNPGYRADDDSNRGPSAQVGVRFEKDGSDADVTVSVTCTAGVPSLLEVIGGGGAGDDHGTGGGGDDPASDDHGGGSGGGGSGSNRGSSH